MLAAVALIATLAGCHGAPETAQALPKKSHDKIVMEKDEDGFVMLGNSSMKNEENPSSALERNKVEFRAGGSRGTVGYSVKEKDFSRACEVVLADAFEHKYKFSFAYPNNAVDVEN